MKIAGWVAPFLAAAVSLWSNIDCAVDPRLPEQLTINIEFFYTISYGERFRGDDALMEKDINVKLINEAQRILDKFTWVSGPTIKLHVLRKTSLGSNGPSHYKEELKNLLRGKIATDGDKDADLFVFISTVGNLMSSVEYRYQGKMCHKDRSYRIYMVGIDVETVYYRARHLVHFIGQLLDMDEDYPSSTTRDGKSHCNYGPMYLSPSKKKDDWNRCNTEDFADFYNGFVQPQNGGRVRKKFCLGPQPLPNAMTIGIHAFYDRKFHKLFGKNLRKSREEIEKVVKKAEVILNKDNSLGPRFILKVMEVDWYQPTGHKTREFYGRGITITSKASALADIFVFFTSKERYLPSTHKSYIPSVCATYKPFRTFIVNRNKNGFTSYGAARQLVYSIGLSLGMEDDAINECTDEGYMRYKEVDGKVKSTWKQVYRYWNHKDTNWNNCNVEDLKKAYAKTTTSRVDGPGAVWRTGIRHCLEW